VADLPPIMGGMSARLIESVTPEQAAHVLWFWSLPGREGLEPGSFTRSLLEAIVRADSDNRRRLWLGFPDYVHAMDVGQWYPGGIEALRERAGVLVGDRG
jgi:hypothetical protein